jgi:glycosyltransferase involved in cell wall biosynthesis
MASGLPVLASGVGGNAELVATASALPTGRIVPAGDVQALAEALVRAACEPAEARAMGVAGRARVVQHFSLPAMVGAYQGLYDRLLAGRTGERTTRTNQD